LAGICGKVCSPEPQWPSIVRCSLDDMMRDEDETMGADLTGMFLELRAPLMKELMRLYE
jgi:hypothetical protein